MSGLLFLGLLMTGLGVATPARGAEPSKRSCAEAYESAQESRASGRLRQTQERLAYCAQAACPDFVKADCERWLGEVERELPSVVVSASGVDEGAVISVTLDGQVLDGALDGSPLSLDPGPHELVFERPGKAPVLRTVMAQQGVQNRPVQVDLEGSSVADGGNGSESIMRPLAYASWGLGAIGLGVFGVLGTLSRADKQALDDDCKMKDPNPPTPDEVLNRVCWERDFQSRENDYKQKEVLADVGLVLGIAGAATGTVLFILSAATSSDGATTASPLSLGSVRFDAGATHSGAWASVGGTF